MFFASMYIIPLVHRGEEYKLLAFLQRVFNNIWKILSTAFLYRNCITILVPFIPLKINLFISIRSLHK